jgi:protein phosphatase
VLHNEPLDGFLICSDGLHGYVAPEILKSIVFDRDSDPSLRARRLVKQALLAGGYDNISVILLDLEGEML